MNKFTLCKELTIEQRAQLAVEIIGYSMAMYKGLGDPRHHMLMVGMAATIAYGHMSIEEKEQLIELTRQKLDCPMDALVGMLTMATMETLRHTLRQKALSEQDDRAEADGAVQDLLNALPGL